MNVSIIGLGAMGTRMARRLLDAGHRVTVFNRSRQRAQALVEDGAALAASPREAAATADIVITMVRDDEASGEVWLDPESGALAGLRPDAIAIESSTISPAWAHALGSKMAEHGRAFLEAPVAGSRPQAEAGQLIYLVGGDGAVLERVRDLLLSMGGSIHHLGPVGAGCVMKLAVNALFGVQVAALGELLALLNRSGIELDRAMEVLGEMPVTSAAARGVGGAMAARKFAPMFPIDLVAKDFGYVAAAAERVGAECPTASAVGNVYVRAGQSGLAGENIAAVIKLFEPRS